MHGMRVLDVGCAKGFFSFETERRSAAKVVAVDSFPDSVRRFNICRDALTSKAVACLTNVYDLSPRTFGTFDLAMPFGVLYHLRHPILSLEKLASVYTGTLLLQTANYEHATLDRVLVAERQLRTRHAKPYRFHGQREALDDPRRGVSRQVTSQRSGNASQPIQSARVVIPPAQKGGVGAGDQ